MQLQYGRGLDESLLRLRGEIPLDALAGRHNEHVGMPRVLLMLDNITDGDAGRGTVRFSAGVTITLLDSM